MNRTEKVRNRDERVKRARCGVCGKRKERDGKRLREKVVLFIYSSTGFIMRFRDASLIGGFWMISPSALFLSFSSSPIVLSWINQTAMQMIESPPVPLTSSDSPPWKFISSTDQLSTTASHSSLYICTTQIFVLLLWRSQGTLQFRRVAPKWLGGGLTNNWHQWCYLILQW